jgi:mono/diheme cytochrome c family protein
MGAQMRKTLQSWLAIGTLTGAVVPICSQRSSDQAAPAPVDPAPAPDTSAATPPITPPQARTPVDTPPAGQQSASNSTKGPQVSQPEYEGWRQYSVQCARCHGQDALPNPVAANLLTSLAPGGPMADPKKFAQVVSEGRPDRGMPAFKSTMTSAHIEAVYAYLKGRAEKRLPPGRPEEPKG